VKLPSSPSTRSDALLAADAVVLALRFGVLKGVERQS